LTDIDAPPSATAYGTYLDLVNDANTDIIYIATPHSHHYQHARLSLTAGKHILLEKPATVNAAQFAELQSLARSKGLFMMEALWTRFFPLSQFVVDTIRSGKLGAIKRVFADFSFNHDVEREFGLQHRMVNMDLAGGALLDLGIYSLTWVFMALYHAQVEEERKSPGVMSVVSKYVTGADEQTSVLCDFGTGHGIATTSIRVASTPNAEHNGQDDVRIQGTLGDLTVDYAPRPKRVTLTPVLGNTAWKHETNEFPDNEGGGHGMFWEADECARCVRDGKMESGGMGWKESGEVLKVLDEVRRQGQIVYEESLESVDYPLGGFGI
jgi:predicted dehydrogenase